MSIHSGELRGESLNEAQLIEEIQNRMIHGKVDICLPLITNLAKVLYASSENIDVGFIRNKLFDAIPKILQISGSIPIRIICAKILQLIAIQCAAQTNVTFSTMAISFLYNAFTAEVQKILDPGDSTGSIQFLITVIDSTRAFIKANIDYEDSAFPAIQELLKLRSLTDHQRQSIQMTLDYLVRCMEVNKAIDKKRKINSVLRMFSCRSATNDQSYQGSVIPEPHKSTIKERINIQNTLLQLDPDVLINIVVKNFLQMQTPPGYVPPNKDTIDEIIKHLTILKPPATVSFDQHRVNTETACYIIEQSMDKFMQRTKFIPSPLQYQFTSMLINNLDSSEPKFEECEGPATEAAVQKACTELLPTAPFLAAWSSFEFARNSPERYLNLVTKIFTRICIQLNENLNNRDIVDDISTGGEKTDEYVGANPIQIFLTQIPLLPESIFVDFHNQVVQRPKLVNYIVVAMHRAIEYTPVMRPNALLCLLELSKNPLSSIRKPSCQEIIDYFYKDNEFRTKIDEESCARVQEAAVKSSPDDITPLVDLYYSALAVSPESNLLTEVFKVFGKSTNEMKSHMRTELKNILPKLGSNQTIIQKVIEASDETNVELEHWVLYQFSHLGEMPTDSVQRLLKEFTTTGDARFLVPIVPRLKPPEIEKYMDSILSLDQKAVAAALKKAISPQMTRPKILLILHKYEHTHPRFNNALAAAQGMLEKTSYTDCSLVAQAAILQHKYDMVIDTLNKIFDVHKTVPGCQSWIIQQMNSLTHIREILENSHSWEIFKQLIMKMNPESQKVACSLPHDKLAQLIGENIDYAKQLQMFAKHKKYKEELQNFLASIAGA